MEIDRTLYEAVRMHLAQKEITLVVGPRQAGKTTLLKALAEELRARGEICLFFNLDIDRDAQFFSSQTRLVERVEALSEGRRAYVFIDEVQRIENAGLFLKGIYDRALPHKWIATGSGSIELKEKIGESLVGRKRNFYLYPVSPAEFVAYRTGKGVSQGAAVLATDPVESDRLLFAYLLYGGYPRVVTAPNASEKVAMLDEIFQGYIERDIQLLLRVEKSRSFITLLQLLAIRVGRLINWQDLANQTNLSVATVKQYFWYIEKTFIAAPATPYFTNKEKELVKTPQVYFWDSGLRNHLLNLRALDEQSPDFGFLFQQFVWLLLRHQFSDAVSSIHYWRTQHQAEVDFVVNRGADLLPVEVKAARLPEPRVERSLHSFIEAYAPAEAWVVNRTLSDEVWVGKTRVRFRKWMELVG